MQQNLEYLFQKFVNNTLSKKEYKQLMSFIEEPENQLEVEHLLDKYWDTLKGHEKSMIERNVDEGEMLYDRIIHKIEKGDNRQKGNPFVKRLSSSQLYKIAAVFVLVLGTYYGYQTMFPNQSEIIDIIPTDDITLTFDDGRIQVITENEHSQIIGAKGKLIGTQKGKQLDYQNTDISEELVYNKLTVPYGKRFELVLSDGTHVFLNSGSKLRYPVVFLKGKPRDVYLNGEAYFSVEKDENRPFTVITDEMNTSVYGTEFNVTSYENENNTSAVLVEGSVGVYRSNNVEGHKPIIISPGQRAIFQEDSIEVDQVNVNKYTAWTKGKLFFVDDRFELILKELERHFNVTIKNQFSQLNGKRFTGTFSEESLDQILRICQEHTPFSYSVNDDIITIVEDE